VSPPMAALVGVGSFYGTRTGARTTRNPK
jgi:uncharacterized membrane protein YfcA